MGGPAGGCGLKLEGVEGKPAAHGRLGSLLLAGSH